MDTWRITSNTTNKTWSVSKNEGVSTTIHNGEPFPAMTDGDTIVLSTSTLPSGFKFDYWSPEDGGERLKCLKQGDIFILPGVSFLAGTYTVVNLPSDSSVIVTLSANWDLSLDTQTPGHETMTGRLHSNSG